MSPGGCRSSVFSFVFSKTRVSLQPDSRHWYPASFLQCLVFIFALTPQVRLSYFGRLFSKRRTSAMLTSSSPVALFLVFICLTCPSINCEDEILTSSPDATAAQDESTVHYSTPNLDSDGLFKRHLYESFDDEILFNQRWIQSKATKAESEDLKYDGDWDLVASHSSIRGESLVFLFFFSPLLLLSFPLCLVLNALYLMSLSLSHSPFPVSTIFFFIIRWSGSPHEK